MARTKPPGSMTVGQALSRREVEILQFIGEGLTRDEIARKMFLSPNTVRSHQASIYYKMDAKNSTHAVAIALAVGVLSLNDVKPGDRVSIGRLRASQLHRQTVEDNRVARIPETRRQTRKSAFVGINGDIEVELFQHTLTITDPDTNGWSHTEISGVLARVYARLKDNLGQAVLSSVRLPGDRFCPVGQNVLVRLDEETDGSGEPRRTLTVRWRHNYVIYLDQRLYPAGPTR